MLLEPAAFGEYRNLFEFAVAPVAVASVEGLDIVRRSRPFFRMRPGGPKALSLYCVRLETSNSSDCRMLAVV